MYELLQPFSQEYDIASHTTDVVYVNLIHMWRFRTIDFLLRNFPLAILFTLRVFARNLLRGYRCFLFSF